MAESVGGGDMASANDGPRAWNLWWQEAGTDALVAGNVDGNGVMTIWDAPLRQSMARMTLDRRADESIVASGGDQSESRAMVVWNPLASTNLRAEVRLVDLPPICESVVPRDVIAELVEQSRTVLALHSSPDTCAPTGSLALNDVDMSSVYGLQSDFALLRQGLQQQQGPSTASESARRDQELGTVRIKRVPESTISPIGSKCNFLAKQAAAMFKSVLRKNLDTVFIANLVVPKLLDGDSIAAALHDMRTESSIRGASSSPCQVILHARLLADDEARVRASPTRIISESDRLLKTLKLSPISLTKATLAVPSFWRQQVVLDSLPAFDREVKSEINEPEVPDPHQDHPTWNGAASPALAGVTKNLTDESATACHTTSESSPSTGEREATVVSSQPRLQLKIIADDEDIGTDYLLSDMFLRCNWADDTNEANHKRTAPPQPTIAPGQAQSLEDRLIKLARPALWELARKKVMAIRDVSMHQALLSVDLGKLQAVICHLLGKIKNIRLNPAVATHEEVTEACTSFREALWVHTLRLILLCEHSDANQTTATSNVVSKILLSSKYKQALGAIYWRHLEALHDSMIEPSHHSSDPPKQQGTRMVQKPIDTAAKLAVSSMERLPVRLLCSMEFLSQDDLLDELQNNYDVAFVEREVPAPIGIIIDERNGICLLHLDLFEDDERVKSLVIQLAQQQIQYERLWVILHGGDMLDTPVQNALHVFYSALVNFRINVTTLLSKSISETCELVRQAIDSSADAAVRIHRVLPKMWYERPFLLEVESQHERFLASTGVVNYFSAQSLLHKISLDDLLTRSIDDLRPLVLGSITETQLQLLWR